MNPQRGSMVSRARRAAGCSMAGAAAFCGALALASLGVAAATPPQPLMAADLAVVVNTRDPLSAAIGDYYVNKRSIPTSNVVRIDFEPDRDELPPAEFTALRAAILKQTRERIQAYALTWARPYRAGCMSITSALTFGVNASYCASQCAPTKSSPYFNSSAVRPYDELHLRPTLTLAALDLEHAKALIDRGVSADAQRPAGTAYLVTTDDSRRDVRSAQYPLAIRIAQHEFGFHVVVTDHPGDPADVMFYFTGAASVPGIDGYRFLPGAIADHLTSFGGELTDSRQMSSLRWLEAGATGSYGTVVEPCNLPGKFPNVAVLLAHYLGGETLIESYWKSVRMPGQGIFIGEPLAAPFRSRGPSPPAAAAAD